MPPKKRGVSGGASKAGVAKNATAKVVAAKPVAKAEAAEPVASAATTVDANATIRIRVDKFSKINEEVLSEEKVIGGFPWQLSVTAGSGPIKSPQLSLTCLYSREAKVWHCKAQKKWRVMDINGIMQDIKDDSTNELFASHKPSQKSFTVMDTIKRESKKYVKNDTVEIEVEIKVEKEAGDRFRKKLSIDYYSASDMFDGELDVGKKNIHVNKQFLSMHSPVFKAHFFENSKDELKLEESDEKALINFLNLLYRVEDTASADTVEGALQMAERFKVQALIDHIEWFLYTTATVKVSEKIRMAEKYNLSTLLRGALLTLQRQRDPTLQKEVINCSAFKEYSAKTKKAVKDAKPMSNMDLADSDEMMDDDDDMDGYFMF